MDFRVKQWIVAILSLFFLASLLIVGWIESDRLLPDKKAKPVVTAKNKACVTCHESIADTYREGRVFLAGDAAHINNPLGGMGLNFGIHDAVNLTEKMGRVWRGEAEDDVFDLYVRQRRTVAVEYLHAQTMQNKKDLEEKDEAVREKTQDEWRRTADDPELARKFLLRTAMFEGVRRAASIQ